MILKNTKFISPYTKFKALHTEHDNIFSQMTILKKSSGAIAHRETVDLRRGEAYRNVEGTRVTL